MTRILALVAVLAVPVLPAGARAQSTGDFPYLYQHAGQTRSGLLMIESETAYGTRETRPFGEQGVEQGLRLRWAPTSFLVLEGWGGAVFTGGGYRGAAGSIDAYFGVLDQARHVVNLTLGGGCLLDFRTVVVPRLYVALSRSFGPLDLALSTRVEFPLGGRRDVADVVLGLAASCRVARWARVGAEVLAQDIEGFWEKDEAEGGAKIVLGPTAWFAPGRHFEVKVNAGAVIPASTNAPRNAAPGVSPPVSGYGFLGRLALAWVM